MSDALFQIAAVLVLGIGSQWLAWRLKFPSIIFLLLAGFVSGPVTGFIHPDELLGDTFLPIVSISVAIILFEGALTLKLEEFKHIGRVLLLLVTVGVIITWLIGALSAYTLLNLDLPVSILLGSILVVTGPTVIGPMLRHIRPTGKVANILKWEGILIDPVGALLAVLVFDIILLGEQQGVWSLAIETTLLTILVGIAGGVVFAFILLRIIRHYWAPDYLQETVSLTFVILSYLCSEMIQHESGLFATTVMGLIIANQKTVGIRHIIVFKENLRVLIISSLFILLAARIPISSLEMIGWPIFCFMLCMILVARPVSAWLSTLGSSLNWRERLFLGALAPRGIVAAAVSSVFALKLEQAGMSQAEYLVPVTFFLIIFTVVVYGILSRPIAQKLEISQEHPQGILLLGSNPLILELAQALQKLDIAVVVIDTNRSFISKARMSGIRSYHGNILSMRMLDQIDFDGIGRVLAMTPSDEFNTLAVLHLSDIFERKELFQLQPVAVKTDDQRQDHYTPHHLRGRYLFGNEFNIHTLNMKMFLGFTIKFTKLTETFTYEEMCKHYNNEIIPLITINGDSNVNIISAENPPSPQPGQTVVALVSQDNS